MHYAPPIFDKAQQWHGGHMDITFLKLPEVCKKTGLSRSTVYKLIKAGKFPKQIKLTEHSSAWIASEIQTWADDIIANRDSAVGL